MEREDMLQNTANVKKEKYLVPIWAMLIYKICKNFIV